MIITIHLSDGRKITKDNRYIQFVGGTPSPEDRFRLAKIGYITVNWNHVVDLRPAEEDEIEHARIHGW